MEQILHITDIGAGGDGIARDANGAAVFVPFTVTGDLVKAEISAGDGVLRGVVQRIEKESPERQKPPCRHFGICGGCALQHVKDTAYRIFKTRQVTEILEKAGLSVPDFETVFIPHATRRRANFASRVVKGKTIIGFHERKSGNIRDIPDCLLITENVRRVMEALRPFMLDIAGEGPKMDILIQCVEGQCEIGLTGKIKEGWEAQQALSDAMATTKAARISLRARDYEPYETLLEAMPVLKRFGSLTVRLTPGAFLQPSAEGEQVLTQCVRDGVADAKHVSDLFCGCGTFTGIFPEGREVWAADAEKGAIQSLQRAGVIAFERNLFKEPYKAEELQDRDCVILDPPRAGASAQVQELAGSGVPKIVYVSCNLQSFARDAMSLSEGGYRLNKLTLVDQFIWSAHTEVVGVFVKA